MAGHDPFAGLRIDAADLRHACEVKARGHLLHLREGYLEAHGRSDAVAELIGDSAPALAALLAHRREAVRGAMRADAAAARWLVEQELRVEDGTFGEIVRLAGGRTPSSEAGAPAVSALSPGGGAPDGARRSLECRRCPIAVDETLERSAGGRIRGHASALRACGSLLALSASPRHAQDAALPELTAPVHDLANVIDPASERRSTTSAAGCRPPAAM